MRQHVVGDEQVGAASVRGELARELAAEEPHDRRDAELARRLGDVRGRLDAERRDAALDEVLQQVAVVARDLDDQAVGAEAEALDRHRRRSACVRDPGVGVRREVGVLGEDVLRRHELLELHQQAVLADLRVERIERLHRVGAVGRHVALAQRRHAEVDERVAQRRRAEAAAGRRRRAGDARRRARLWMCGRHVHQTRHEAPDCRRTGCQDTVPDHRVGRSGRSRPFVWSWSCLREHWTRLGAPIATACSGSTASAAPPPCSSCSTTCGSTSGRASRSNTGPVVARAGCSTATWPSRSSSSSRASRSRSRRCATAAAARRRAALPPPARVADPARLLGGAVLSMLVTALAPAARARRRPPRPRACVVHGLLLQDVVGSESPNGALWSIAIEWQIYFVFPLILLLARRTSARRPRSSSRPVVVLAAHAVAAAGGAARQDRRPHAAVPRPVRARRARGAARPAATRAARLRRPLAARGARGAARLRAARGRRRGRRGWSATSSGWTCCSGSASPACWR